MYRVIFLIFLFFHQLSIAQVPLPPLRAPQELLDNAQKGRYDFMDSIYEIRNSSMERRSVKDNILYESLLPELKKIELELKFPEFGISPTDELGDFLTSCLAPRFQLDDLSTNDIEIFVKYSKEETLFNAIGNQIQYLSQKPRIEEEWRKIFEQSSLFIKLISDKPKASKLLIDTSYTLQGHIITQYLFLYYKVIDLDSFLASIKKIKNSDNLERIIKFTASQWNKNNDPQFKIKLFKMALAASLQINEYHDDSSIGVIHIIGETLLSQIKDLIRYDIFLDETSLSLSTSFFIQRDWQDLADILIHLKADEMFPIHFNNYYLLTSKSLSNPELWLFPEQLRKLREFMNRLNLKILGDNKPKEGGYYTNDGKFFWMISTAPWSSHLVLLNKWGDLIQNFPLANYLQEDSRIAYYSQSKDGELDTLSSHIELFINNPFAYQGFYATNHGAISFNSILSINFPDLNLSSPIPGNYIGFLKSSPMKIELRQLSYSSWRAAVTFSQTNSKINFTTVSACLPSSSFCSFEAESNNDDEWTFMRLGINQSNEIEGFLIQRNKLTPFLFERE